MFVNENTVFRQSFIKVKICTLDGNCILTEVLPDTIIDSLKIEAVGQLIVSSESTKESLYYNLLHARSGRIISDEQTLRQADITDNGWSWLIFDVTGCSVVGRGLMHNVNNTRIDDVDSSKTETPKFKKDLFNYSP